MEHDGAAGRHESFGDRLRRHREVAGFSQEQLAERSGLSPNAIGALERGERKRPYPDTVRRLADALGLDDEARARASYQKHRIFIPVRDGEGDDRTTTVKTISTPVRDMTQERK